MTVGDLDPEREPSRFELGLEFVRSRLLTIVLLIVCLAAMATAVTLFAIWYWDLSLGLPRWLRIAAAAVAFTAPYWYLVFQWVRARLFDPADVFLLDFDMTQLPGSNVGGLYRVPPQDFRDLDVADGELTELAPNLYIGKRLDLDDGHVVGTWPGSLDQQELTTALSNVYIAREKLEPRARKWDQLAPVLDWWVRAEAADQTESVMAALQENILPANADGPAGERLSDWLEDDLADDQEDVAGPIEEIEDDLTDEMAADLLRRGQAPPEGGAPADD